MSQMAPDLNAAHNCEASGGVEERCIKGLAKYYLANGETLYKIMLPGFVSECLELLPDQSFCLFADDGFAEKFVRGEYFQS